MSYSFFTPIVPARDMPITQSMRGFVDEYLAWGNTCVVLDPTQMETGPYVASLQKRENSWVGMAFKVVTYMTIILPLLALIVKSLFRTCSNVKVTKDFTLEARPKQGPNHPPIRYSDLSKTKLGQLVNGWKAIKDYRNAKEGINPSIPPENAEKPIPFPSSNFSEHYQTFSHGEVISMVYQAGTAEVSYLSLITAPRLPNGKVGEGEVEVVDVQLDGKQIAIEKLKSVAKKFCSQK